MEKPQTSDMMYSYLDNDVRIGVFRAKDGPEDEHGARVRIVIADAAGRDSYLLTLCGHGGSHET